MKKILNILKWAGIALVALVVLVVVSIYGIGEYRLHQTYSVPLAEPSVPTDSASIHEGARLTKV